MIITGGCGYIGSVLASLIPDKNVTIIDRLDYGAEGFKQWGNAKLVQGDFADFGIGKQELIHLASPRLGGEGFKQYVDRSRRLLDTCKSKIVFASSCSVYSNSLGLGYEGKIVEPEDDYARAKLDLEVEVLRKNGVVLRFATAYGDSPVPRADLMINNFALQAVGTRKLIVHSPESVRPFVHVLDIAHSIVWGLSQESGIYNVGGENWKKGDVAKQIASMTGSQIIAGSERDPRDYSVSFVKAQTRGFHSYWTLEHWLQYKLGPR